MIEFHWTVGLLGWLSILLPIILMLLCMKQKEVLYGFLATGLINLLTLFTANSGEILIGGFIFAVFIILALSCFVRLMLTSARAEKYGEDASTNWVSLGWYSLGSLVASGLIVWVVLC